MQPNRRQLLQWAWAGAAGLYLPRSAWARTRMAANPFALGVASGSPTHEAVVLWTRLIFDTEPALGQQLKPVAVRWEVAHDEHREKLICVMFHSSSRVSVKKPPLWCAHRRAYRPPLASRLWWSPSSTMRP